MANLVLKNNSGTGTSITADKFIGNASSTDKWLNARTLTLTGDVSGSVSIDGSKNVSLTATIADSSHNHAASNITSGTLSVSRGGTGLSTLTSGYALVGNGTSAVSLRPITSTITKDSTALITSGGIAPINWMNPGTVIANGTDIATYSTLGKGYVSSETNVGTLSNCPTPNNFALFTFSRTGSNTAGLS